MPDTLVATAEPYFRRVLQLLRNPVLHADQMRGIQSQLKLDLASIDKAARTNPLLGSDHEWQLARNALVFWTDEVLVRHADDWEDYVLEQEYDRECNRAWRYYVEAEKALETGNADLAEVFYLTSVLGFDGDIEWAYRHEMQQPLPGGTQSATEAIQAFRARLARRVVHPQLPTLTGQPFTGDNAPLSGSSSWKASLVAVLLAGLFLLVMLGWWLNGKA